LKKLKLWKRTQAIRLCSVVFHVRDRTRCSAADNSAIFFSCRVTDRYNGSSRSCTVKGWRQWTMPLV